MASDMQTYLINQIKKQGPMTLGNFIERAMTHPQLGYYASESTHPIGKKGDFITAPEVSQMFGEMIGAWIIDVWEQMGGDEITLIECGPGRGTLMADIMRVFKAMPALTQKVHIRFIETSKSLQEAQKNAVQEYIDLKRVSWGESLSEQKGPCIIIGNEFLDALPIEQVIRKNGKWYQRTVDFAPEEDRFFSYGEQAMDLELIQYLPPHVKDNEIYEISPARNKFIKDCLRIINNDSGVALFIDYGHDKTHCGDTLQAVRKHEYTDVLGDVGKSDITSHIDFESLCEVIKKHDTHCEPVTTQRYFLRKLGIEHRAQTLKASAKDRNNDINSDLDRLVGRKQMGDLFKVLCFYSKKSASAVKPNGF